MHRTIKARTTIGIILSAGINLLAVTAVAADPPVGAPAGGAGPATSQTTGEAVAFDSERWVRPDALLAEHLGRKALAGTAFLQDVQFDDGVIEVDVAVSGARSYPGILFRMESRQDYERIYLRPHRLGTLYPDTLQYVPA